MAYSSVNSILGGRGQRRTHRARRSFDAAAARRNRQEAARRRRVAQRHHSLIQQVNRLERRIDRRRTSATGTSLFSPSSQLTSSRRESSIPKLAARLDRKQEALERVARTHRRLDPDYRKQVQQHFEGGPSTLEALEIASLGIPGVGLVTGAGKLLGTRAVGAGIRALAERGATRSAAKETLREAGEAVSRSRVSMAARAQKAAEEGRLLRAAGRRARTPRARAAVERARQAKAREFQVFRNAAERGVTPAARRAVAKGAARTAGKGGKAAVRGAMYPARHPFKTVKADARAQAPLTLATQTTGTDHPVTNLLEAPRVLAEAAVEHPKEFAVQSAKGTRDILLGSLPAIYQLGAGVYEAAPLTPGDGSRLEQLGKTVGADYAARYGPLLEGDEEEFKKRVIEGYTMTDPETGKKIHVPGGGLAPYALDTLIAAPPLGRGAGALARRGVLGSGAKSFATKARPVQRISGDLARERPPSRNLFVQPFQRGADRVRGRVTQRRATRGDAIAQEALEKGQITPLLRGHAAKRATAGMKGRAILAGRTTQAEEVGHGLLREHSRDLSRAERRGVHPAVTLGIRTPDEARSVLTKRIEAIKAGRIHAQYEGPRSWDNVPTLEKLRENADKVFTPALAEFADAQVGRGARVAELDPSIKPEQAELRAKAQQGELLGVRRVADTDEPSIIAATSYRSGKKELHPEFEGSVREITADHAAHVTAFHKAKGAWAGDHEPSAAVYLSARTPLDVDSIGAQIGKAWDQDAVARFIADGKNGADHAFIYSGLSELGDSELQALIKETGVAGATLDDEGRLIVMGSGQDLKFAEAVQRLNQELDQVPADVPGHFRIIERDGYDSALEAREAGLTGGAAGVRGGPDAPGSKAPRAEPPAEFLQRLEAARKREGLAEGGYFPSQVPRKRPDFSVRAFGGTKAVAAARRYSGKLYRVGIEDTRLHILAEGFLRNIKRATNWNLVSDVFERTTLPWSRERSMVDLLAEIETRGIDENSVVFVNVKRFRNFEAGDAMGDPNLSLDPEHIGSEAMDAAIKDSVMTPAEAEILRTRNAGGSVNPGDFRLQQGWALMDKAAFDEIASGMKQTAFGRVANIVLTQKPSRWILGSLNIPWLKFQVMSNALMTGLVAGVGPGDWVRAAKWYSGLTPAQKKAVSPYLGDGSHFFAEESKLGAASTNSLVNTYRALKETAGGKVIWAGDKRIIQTRDLNPFNVMFGGDRAQNNFFRRAIFYNRLKREAYTRMGENVGELGQLQNRLMGYLQLDPKGQMRAMLDDPATIERNAEVVNEILGDYTTFTSFERTYLKRYVMFYSFLRFSLRLAFYTMPVKHPVMSGILGQFARMEAAEVQDLLGGDLLPYALGRTYFDDGNLVADFSRANPVMNALSQVAFGAGLQGKLNGLTGLFSPWLGSLYSQMAAEEGFSGKSWLVEGEPGAREIQGYGLEDRVRILANDTLGMFFPYRVLETIERDGRPVGADHLLFSPRYTQYSPETMKDIKRNAEKLQSDFGTELFHEFFPELPAPSNDLEAAEGLRRRLEEERVRLGQIKSSAKPDSLRDLLFPSGSSGGVRSQMFPGSSSNSIREQMFGN